ncbi:MAG: hypothetical protein H6Q70_3591 [Firmicutes bacterium]|nr:hypothetical protein [Bacillota bacterium]
MCRFVAMIVKIKKIKNIIDKKQKNIYTILSNASDSVAQLDRVFDYESKGRRFDSCQGHHLFYLKKLLYTRY